MFFRFTLKRYTSAKDFCEEHFINFSIFKQVSDRLNNHLARFNCYLNLKRREKICGNEKDFRSFFFILAFISGTSLVPFLSKTNQAQLQNFIGNLSKPLPFYFTYTDLLQIKINYVHRFTPLSIRFYNHQLSRSYKHDLVFSLFRIPIISE